MDAEAPWYKVGERALYRRVVEPIRIPAPQNLDSKQLLIERCGQRTTLYFLARSSFLKRMNDGIECCAPCLS